ncbi:FAD-binding oxidoreductase [Kordia sp.]|uniref:FAD-binding oxidoreductase n=1 Tax=Kordia sp. TaxID=1965332 RepID=UPI003D2964FB
MSVFTIPKTTYNNLLIELEQNGIKYEETKGDYFPAYAQMHNHDAVIPQLIISPISEWGVSKTFSIFTRLGIYNNTPVSVKSGGHGYFNGASCEGIMINLSLMEHSNIINNTLTVQPGCIVGQIIYLLHKNKKALPHGDCFDVHAGGHFTTAGWDFILSRKYGLGCQSVIGGRIVLWDGTILDVNEASHPELLWALKGGAAAETGVVTELHLNVINEPETASWCLCLMTQEELNICVSNAVFYKSCSLPREISVSYRIHFEPGYDGPVCSFNVFSLFSISKTMEILKKELGNEVTDMLERSNNWKTGSILDVRMVTASDYLTENPEAIAEVTSEKLRKSPLTYWEETSWKREMKDSHFNTLSSWTLQNCDSMFIALLKACEKIKEHPLRWKMYILTSVGGANIKEKTSSMRLGEVLTRYELHWDDESNEEDKKWAKKFTDEIYTIMLSKEDKSPGRVYRGDIWLHEQAFDEDLEKVKKKYACVSR